MSSDTLDSNVATILRQLTEPSVEADVSRTRKSLKQALELDNGGADVKSLIPVVVKFFASHDIVCKKLAFWFVQRHGDEDYVLLAINSLMKDCSDPSPMTRGLALRTLTGLPRSDTAEYSSSLVRKALEDSSAYVRRIAVIGCLKLHSINEDNEVSLDVVDTLYSMIRDPDPIVVVNVLNVLDEMLKVEGGVVINKNIAVYLLNNINMFSDWNLTSIFTYLRKYKPSDEEEIYAVMNLADKHLTSNNATVVYYTLEYFLTLTEDLPELQSEVLDRAASQLSHILGLGHPELNLALLNFFSSKLGDQQFIQSLHRYYQSFYCKHSDPLYVKKRKIEILSRITCSDNQSEILGELGMYSTDIDTVFALHAIQAIGAIAEASPPAFNTCVRKLQHLLTRQTSAIAGQTLEVLAKLDISTFDDLEALMEMVLKCVDLVLDAPGKSALLCLLGEHSQAVDDVPYIVESMANEFIEETAQPCLLSESLSCLMKLFLHRPGECQVMLGRVLEKCLEDKHVQVRDLAKFYYNILRTDVNVAKYVVLKKL